MKLKITPLLLIIILIFTGCSPKLTVEVNNIKDIQNYKGPGIIYFLPKTQIIINIQTTKITEKKGDLAEYAGEFLGNINVINQNKSYWEITDIDITTKAVRDTDNAWYISGNAPWIFTVNLTPEGFLTSINKPIQSNIRQKNTIEKFIQPKEYKTINQNITTIDRGYKEVYDTIFKVEKLDTISRIIPIIKRRLIQKDKREQAKEIADEIFSLRDDRIALLIGEGDSEYLPEGEALKIMLQGIDEIEKQYLSLFTGQIDKTNVHYKFTYTPIIRNKITKIIIYRFSPQYGLLSADDMRGQPIYLEIETLDTTPTLKNFISTQDLLRRIEGVKINDKGLAYIIPEQAIVKIKLGNKLLAQKEIFLSQAGTIGYLPLKLLTNPDIEIEFDPWTGALKNISYKK